MVPLVVSFGGGVNSAAMLVGMKERGITPSLIIFADTGGEKPETYSFVSQMSEWTIENLGQAIITTKTVSPLYATLEDACLYLKTLPSVVYGFRKCSQRWKIEPVNKWLNHWEPAKQCWKSGEKVIKAIGIDAGEQRRAKIYDDPKYISRYFLIEWGWDREECKAAILRAGLQIPTKSACFFCPSSTKKEVFALKREHPELFDRAVDLEHAASEKLIVIKGLGRHWSWEELVANAENQGKLFPETVQAPCVCFDGEEDD
jgi:hypothetical protein